MGSAVPPAYYSLACHGVEFYRDSLLTVKFILAVLAFSTTQFKCAQGFGPLVFLSQGAFAWTPFYMAKYLSSDYQDQIIIDENVVDIPYMYGCIVYVLGVFFLVSKVPERFFPVRFDIVG